MKNRLFLPLCSVKEIYEVSRTTLSTALAKYSTLFIMVPTDSAVLGHVNVGIRSDLEDLLFGQASEAEHANLHQNQERRQSGSSQRAHHTDRSSLPNGPSILVQVARCKALVCTIEEGELGLALHERGNLLPLILSRIDTCGVRSMGLET
ncbi:hypothetical protein KCU92_g365, partial [Aureobasidium melanogenum]